MSLVKKIFLFLLCSNYCFSQDIILEYVGRKKENVNFICQSVFALNTPTSVNDQDPRLVVKTENPTVINCVDYKKRTPIFALPSETIEFEINNLGLIKYICKTNKYRELESQFVNESFVSFGAAENISDFNELKLIQALNKATESFDPYYVRELAFLQSSLQNNTISKEFYAYFNDMYWSLIKYNELEKKPISSETFIKISESFKKGDQLIVVNEYRGLLNNYLEKFLLNAGIEDNIKNKIEFICRHFDNQKIKDYLLYINMDDALNSSDGVKKIDKTSVELFKIHCKNQKYLDAINLDFEPQKAPIALEKIINKHTGKLVFVDFWASWCIPCRQEFPYQKNLMAKYPDVAFIFISIDKSVAAWEKAMAQYNNLLTSQNSYLYGKSEVDKLMKEIKITSIPRYVLFAKDGVMIHKDAPRPSSQEIEILLQNNL